MGDSDSRISRINALSARPGRAKSVNFNVWRFYFQINFFGFGHDRDGYGASMDAAGFFRFRHSLHAVRSGFIFQVAIDMLAGDGENNFFVAADADAVG